MIHAALGALVMAAQETADTVVTGVAVLVYVIRSILEAFGTIPELA